MEDKFKAMESRAIIASRILKELEERDRERNVEMNRLRQDNEDLNVRVATLNGRVASLTAEVEELQGRRRTSCGPSSSSGTGRKGSIEDAESPLRKEDIPGYKDEMEL